MTATGWYNLVTRGDAERRVQSGFCGCAGNPLGDPYGSMAMAERGGAEPDQQRRSRCRRLQVLCRG